MPSLYDLTEVPRRDMHVFYVLDTSWGKYEFKDLLDVLLYMRERFRFEIFRNPPRMTAVIKDLSPSLRRDANILRQLGEKGFFRELEQADEKNRARITFKIQYWLENELFMRTEQAAHYAQTLEGLYRPNNRCILPNTPKIDALNRLVEESVGILRQWAKEHDDVRVKIAVLEFNAQCRWITCCGPEDLEEFVYDLDYGGIECNLGAVLRELNSKLSRREFLGSMVGALMPVVIFITDGHATDDYTGALEELRKNRWFRRASKIAFTLSDNADVKTVASVVRNSEAVIRGPDIDMTRLIRGVLNGSLYKDFLVPMDFYHTSGADIIQRAMVDFDEPKKVSIPEPDQGDSIWEDEW